MKAKAATKSDRTRQRILNVAAEAFREAGVERVGVRDVMKRAGLTRGGFYFHFADKEALLTDSIREATRGNAASHSEWIQSVPKGKELEGFINGYLSEQHRDHPESGCVVAALGGELGRLEASQRIAIAEGLEPVTDCLAALFPDADPSARRERADLLIASLSGVIVAARLMSNRRRSNAFLANARRFYVDVFSK